MGDHQAGALQGGLVHRVGMVLGCDLDLPGQQIFHRVVAAPVAELELVGGGAAGQRDDLVAQADAEDGVSAPQGPHQIDGRGHIFRVARPV